MAEEISNRVQIIKDEGEFIENFDDVITAWDFAQRGTDYKALAILGCQSGGKSTLLNLLFGTTFQVMDHERGRQQTTKGIWLSRAEDAPDILVFDVEGTDSKERGEDDMAFERKTSLFSLALSEILIINLWFTDIGRLQASNLSLLKIVLELNLQLFGGNSEHKKQLLFCIRDWDGRTTVEAVEKQMKTDMANIWAEVQKPEQHAASQMTDFFDFTFVALPHKIFQEKEFFDAVKALKHRFTDPANPQYLWDKAFSPDIPADGFGHYLEQIWETIQANKDLDLPTQKEMLAMFRCDEISSEAYASFCEAVLPISEELRFGNLVPDFGTKTQAMLESAMDAYEAPASRYHEAVATKKGEDLLQKIKKDLHTMFLDLLGKLRGKAVDDFEELLQGVLPEEESAVLEQFAATMNGIKKQVLDAFVAQAQAAVVEQAVGEWKFDADQADLTKTLEKRIQTERENQLRKMMEYLQKELKMTVLEPLEDLMDASEPDMWERIRTLHAGAQEEMQQTLAGRLVAFECTEADVAKQVAQLEKHVTTEVLDAVRARSENLYDDMMKKFEQRFKYDDDGLPRKWEKGVDIPDLYQKAFNAVVETIDLFAIIRLKEEHSGLSHSNDDDKVPPEITLLSKRQCNQLKQRFKQATDGMFSSARSDQDRNSITTQIPTFMIVLLLIFAYDELWWILSNPFLFSLSLTFGGIAVLIWYLELGYLVTPVLNTIVGTSFNQLKNTAQGYIQPAQAQHAKVE